jgi:hypothetical protein
VNGKHNFKIILNEEEESMNHSNHLPDEKDRELDNIAKAVAGIPDVSPPDKLLQNVMARIQPKRIRFIRRWWRGFRTPMTAITITPLRLASLGVSLAALILITWAIMIQFPRDQKSNIAMGSKEGTNVPVVFSLDMPGVSSVDVIGSFNAWTPGNYHMQWDPKKRLWTLTIHIREGTYEYAFLVNGKTILPDPNALMYREDGFGQKNSVLIINKEKDNGTHI